MIKFVNKSKWGVHRRSVSSSWSTVYTPQGRQINSSQVFHTLPSSSTLHQVKNLFLYKPYGCVGGDGADCVLV